MLPGLVSSLEKKRFSLDIHFDESEKMPTGLNGNGLS